MTGCWLTYLFEIINKTRCFCGIKSGRNFKAMAKTAHSDLEAPQDKTRSEDDSSNASESVKSWRWFEIVARRELLSNCCAVYWREARDVRLLRGCGRDGAER